MKRKLVLALGLTALTATAAYAAGLWPNLPVVGGASYCSGYSTGTNGQVCGPTVPAGPSAVTGSETIPADTNKANGANPQTVRMTMAALNALPISYVAGSITAANSLSPTVLQGGVIITAASALSPTTVQLPPAAMDGQQFRISATQNIATLTVNASDATVSNAPTALTVSTTGSYGYQFRYRASTDTWYRID